MASRILDRFNRGKQQPLGTFVGPTLNDNDKTHALGYAHKAGD